MSAQPFYDQDFYGWANQQARLLRAGKLSEADLEHIADEIESIGKAEKRILTNLLAGLLVHLLEWEYQPGCRNSSWNRIIRIKRRDLTMHMKDSPSLQSVIPKAMENAYGNALIEAADETGFPEGAFPSSCPWTFDQVMSAEFWPGA